MKKFELLKTTYPTSDYERQCDGYRHVMVALSKEERIRLGIDDEELSETIKEGERYMYRVGKENGEFKTMCISMKNFEILRKHWFLFED